MPRNGHDCYPVPLGFLEGLGMTDLGGWNWELLLFPTNAVPRQACGESWGAEDTLGAYHAPLPVHHEGFPVLDEVGNHLGHGGGTLDPGQVTRVVD